MLLLKPALKKFPILALVFALSLERKSGNEERAVVSGRPLPLSGNEHQLV
jgi:hypothetical protein